MASVSGDGRQSKLNEFYSAWKGNLKSESEERVVFASLSDQEKTTVVLALKALSTHSTDGPDPQKLKKLIEKLQTGENSPIKFKVVDESSLELGPNERADAINRSFKTIMQMQKALPTEDEKGRMSKAENLLRGIFDKHTLLDKLFNDSFVTSILDKLTPSADGQYDVKKLASELENWVRQSIPRGGLQTLALEQVDKIFERETTAREIPNPLPLRQENVKQLITDFKEKVIAAYIDLHPELTSEDLSALAELGLKGKSRGDVIGYALVATVKYGADALKDLYVSTLESMKSAVNLASQLRMAKETVDDLKQLPAAGKEFLREVLILSFGFALTALEPSKWGSALSKVFNVIISPAVAMFDRIGELPENQVFEEIEKLTQQVDQKRSEIEKEIARFMSIRIEQVDQVEVRDVSNRLLAYTANVNFLLGLRELRENLSQKGSILRPHLAEGHGAQLMEQARFLLSHVAASMDMVWILQNPGEWERITRKMGDDRSTPILAYRALVGDSEEELPFPDERVAIEKLAASRFESAVLWLQYARSRGDGFAPTRLAELITTLDPAAWAPERTAKTYAQAKGLLDEAITKGTDSQKKVAQANKVHLLRMRLDAAIQNARPPEEQAAFAHELIGEWVRTYRGNALKTQLFELAKLGFEEAAEALVALIVKKGVRGSIDDLDVRTLAALATFGYTLPEVVLGSELYKFSSIESFNKDAFEKNLSHQQVRSLAMLAVHQNRGAKELLDQLNLDSIQKTNVEDKDITTAFVAAAKDLLDNTDNLTHTDKLKIQEFINLYLYLAPGFGPTIIPSFVDLGIGLDKIKARVDTGRATEEDVETLLKGVRFAQPGALDLLKTLMSQNRLETISLDTQLFATWVLNVAEPAGFPDLGWLEDKIPQELNDPEEVEAKANFLERYKTLFKPQAEPSVSTSGMEDQEEVDRVDIGTPVLSDIEAVALGGAGPSETPSSSPFSRLTLFFSGIGSRLNDLFESSEAKIQKRVAEFATSKAKDVTPDFFSANYVLRFDSNNIEQADKNKEAMDTVIKVLFEATQNTDNEADLINFTKKIDVWIKELKREYQRPEDQAVVESSAPALFGQVLGEKLFPSDKIVLPVGVSKDKLAEFIVRHRAKFNRPMGGEDL